MITLDWRNPYWAPVALSVSYSINQQAGVDTFTLTRSQSNRTDVVALGEFESLAEAQAAAQADCDKFFGTI